MLTWRWQFFLHCPFNLCTNKSFGLLSLWGMAYCPPFCTIWAKRPVIARVVSMKRSTQLERQFSVRESSRFPGFSTHLSQHSSMKWCTCAVNCAFCCSAATRRCNSASSASPSSAIVGVRRPAGVRTRSSSATPPSSGSLERSPLRSWTLGGTCDITASGPLGVLEHSKATWRFSWSWVPSAVAKEVELCYSEAGWSDLLMSLHFSRTSLPQDGVAHSTFTYHQATTLVPKLQLSTGPVRGLSVLCSWACFQLGTWIPALWWTTRWPQPSPCTVTGALDKWSLTTFLGIHCRRLPRQALWQLHLWPLLGFAISTTTM